MKITAVETIAPDITVGRPFFFVQVHTDEGPVGLGQTADLRTIPIVHDLAKAFYLGEDPTQVTRLWHRAFDWVAYHGYAGAETRAISALDIALWDLLGQVTGAPIVALLGGSMRETVPVYNTCGSYGAISDREAFRSDPVALARDLLSQGISCMKSAPLERYTDPLSGSFMSPLDLKEFMKPIDAVADQLDGAMEIALDVHSRLTSADAVRVCRALDGYPIRWLEDPLAQDNAEEWARLREKSPIPIAGGERLQTRHQLRRLIEIGGVDVVISDLTWCGGITEAKRISEFADVYGASFATHGNSGPVNLWSSAHTAFAVRNAQTVETVRAYHDPVSGYYHHLVDGPPILASGQLSSPTAPGLGITLKGDLSASLRQTSSL